MQPPGPDRTAYTQTPYGIGDDDIPLVVEGGAAPAPRRRRRRLGLVIAAGAVVVIVVAAGGAAAVAVRGLLFGGGIRNLESAQAFPVGTYAIQEVAIDPSGQQKLALLDLYSAMPHLQKYLAAQADDLAHVDQSTDFAHALFDAWTKDDPTGLDYDTDIAPWIGNRIAIGAIGGRDSGTGVEIAFASSDPQRGVAAVRTLLHATDDGDLQVRAHGDWVVALPAELDADAAYARGDLADDPSLVAATESLGDWALAASWYSPRAALESSTIGQDDSDSPFVEGMRAHLPQDASVTSVLRVADRALDLTTATHDLRLPAWHGAVGSELESLPSTALVAMTLGDATGLTDIVDSPQMAALVESALLAHPALATGVGGPQSLDTTQPFDDWAAAAQRDWASGFESAGLSYPDDLIAALGTQAIVMMSTDTPTGYPGYGVRVRTSDTSSTASALQAVIDLATGGSEAVYDDGTTGAPAATLVDGQTVEITGSGFEASFDASSGSLGEATDLERSLPDLDRASAAFFVNGSALYREYVSGVGGVGGTGDDQPEAVLQDVAGLGITIASTGDGGLVMHTRIAAKG